MMRRTFLLSASLAAFHVIAWTQPAPPPLELWYPEPAERWTEALPLGNGRLGAMTFGGTSRERIQLNEITLWSGAPQDADNPEALKNLEEVRRLLFAGKFKEAEALTFTSMVCRGVGSNAANSAYDAYGSYQTLGDIMLSFEDSHEKAKEYRRALDLDSVVASVSYQVEGVRFQREMFVSAPDQVLVIRLTADQPAALSFLASLDRDPRRSSHPGRNDSRIEPFEKNPVREAPNVAQPWGDHGLLLGGRAWQGKGMAYEARLLVLTEGGEAACEDGGVRVRKADAVTLLLAGATDYVSWRNEEHNDPAALCADRLAKAAALSYADLRARHTADYQNLFHRVRLALGPMDTPLASAKDLLQAVQQGQDEQRMAVLYYQFGRYLLISSSRPGGLPANLQGLWCDDFQAAWNSDYHHNINDQMNYWPAEVGNLPECHEPFLKFIASLQEPGARTAQIHYGAKGWVVHTISNVWGFTSPGEHPSWGQFTAAAGWLCQHLWQHYEFTGDREYLAWAYPVMKNAAQFYLDFLVPEPKRGWLVTAPSNSPENHFRTSDGQEAGVCYGPSMDMQILWDLFSNCIAAANVLGLDSDFSARLSETRAKLAPPQIGRFGQLQEWIEDYDEVEPGHRHMSHLFALHPGHQITLRATPDLAKAARVSLERRLANGGGHTGWSRAWVINFWARLQEGNQAREHLRALFSKCTLPNFFDNHPPFQMDGNFGGAAGIAEMLLQSHDGAIALLPALPDAWSQGEVRGLCARGGFEVDIAWAHGAVTKATVRSRLGGPCVVRCAEPLEAMDENNVRLASGTEMRWDTKPGAAYVLSIASNISALH